MEAIDYAAVYARYQKLLEWGAHACTWMMRDLRRETGIVPVLDHQKMQEWYRRLIHDRLGLMDYVKYLIEATGISPEESLVQEGYEHFTKKGDVTQLEGLFLATGIRPDIDEEIVQRAFKYGIFKWYTYTLNKFAGLVSSKPDLPEKLVRTAYRTHLIDKYKRRAGEPLYNAIGRVFGIKTLTGISADFTKQETDDLFAICMCYGDKQALTRLYYVCDRAPSEHAARIGLENYLRIHGRYRDEVDNAEFISHVSRMMP